MCAKTTQVGTKDLPSLGVVQLIQLPEDVLQNIFLRLAVRSLGRLSQTCHYFQELISNEMIWRHLCKRGEIVLSVNFVCNKSLRLE